MNKYFPRNLQEILLILNNDFEFTVIGNSDLVINNFNRIDLAAQNEITFYSDDKYEENLKETKSIVIISKANYDKFQAKSKDNISDEINLDKINLEDRTFILLDNPYKAIVRLSIFIDKYNKLYFETQKTNTEQNRSVGLNTQIASNVILEFNTAIGNNTIIYPNCYIGNGVTIGDDCIIYPNVTIMADTKIGKNVIIHSGAVIGSDGFGYYEDNNKYNKIPQIGNVVIDENVEIGANTTIDRSFIGSTQIHKGVKIDNLVQIGHNCVIGEDSAMAAQVGIAGSVNIGKRVKLGGQVGLAGHLDIVDDVIIIAQSGVSKSILEKGTYFGSPIKEAGKAFRIEAILRNLPDLSKEIKNISLRVKKMEEKG